MGVIPTKIVVGFQKREDTYTGKLGYVCYYKGKDNDKIHQTSLKTWANKDIPYENFDNVPTEGFVLNRKVGGHSYGWHGRTVKARVYDPRGFEFEIDMENLLYILENANSYKGKALEGEFVYAWMGSGSVFLMPVDSPEYKSHYKLISDLEDNKKIDTIKKKELVVGKTYINRKNQTVLYCGTKYLDYGLSEYTVIDKNPKDNTYFVSGYNSKSTAMISEVCVGEISFNYQIYKIPKDVIKDNLREDNLSKTYVFNYIKPSTEKGFSRWYVDDRRYIIQNIETTISKDEADELYSYDTVFKIKELNLVSKVNWYFYCLETESFEFFNKTEFQETFDRPSYVGNDFIIEIEKNNYKLSYQKLKTIIL